MAGAPLSCVLRKSAKLSVDEWARFAPAGEAWHTGLKHVVSSCLTCAVTAT